jgi:hypothetical protein
MPLIDVTRLVSQLLTSWSKTLAFLSIWAMFVMVDGGLTTEVTGDWYRPWYALVVNVPAPHRSTLVMHWVDCALFGVQPCRPKALKAPVTVTFWLVEAAANVCGAKPYETGSIGLPSPQSTFTVVPPGQTGRRNVVQLARFVSKVIAKIAELSGAADDRAFGSIAHASKDAFGTFTTSALTFVLWKCSPVADLRIPTYPVPPPVVVIQRFGRSSANSFAARKAV